MFKLKDLGHDPVDPEAGICCTKDWLWTTPSPFSTLFVAKVGQTSSQDDVTIRPGPDTIWLNIDIYICTTDEISHSVSPSRCFLMFSLCFCWDLLSVTSRLTCTGSGRNWQHREGILIHATNSVNLYSSIGYKIPQLTVSVQWFTPPCGDWWRPHTTGFHSVSSVSTIEKLHSPR